MAPKAAGFTLIELLVVVVIGAVLAGLAVLSLGAWRSEEDPERVLQRFSALLEAHCEQALFQSRPRGVRLSADGYEFWQAASTGWVRVPTDGIGRPRSWPDGLELRLFVEGRRQALDEAQDLPQIVCQPLGDMTVFELELGFDGELLRLWSTTGGQLSQGGPS